MNEANWTGRKLMKIVKDIRASVKVNGREQDKSEVASWIKRGLNDRAGRKRERFKNKIATLGPSLFPILSPLSLLDQVTYHVSLVDCLRLKLYLSIWQIDIQFIVADATTKTVLQPSINICACQNQGVCTPVEEEAADNSADSNENKFTILSCTCQNGYTGTFCDADLDACEENFQPCYPGVTCNDLPAPANKTRFKCDPCPNGYSGDGIECSGNCYSFYQWI